MEQTDEPFFRREGELLVPNPCARGPWANAGLHGRVIAGLLGSEIERVHGDPDFMPVRLTVDMYRAPPMVPLAVETRVVRDSRRIRVVDADIISEGRSAGRASCQFLRRGENPSGNPWFGETSKLPHPDSLPPGVAASDTMFDLWEMRWIEGSMETAGRQRQVWMRENRELVEGEPPSAFARVTVAADYASPLANTCGGRGYAFINSDLTIYLDRLPSDEWVGFESISHEASDGIGIGHCNLYDTEGRIGWASACGLAQQVRADIAERAEQSR